MNKAISLAIFIAGIVLLVFGINATESVGSQISEAVTGTPSDRSIWLLVLGVIGIVAGGVSLLFSKGK